MPPVTSHEIKLGFNWTIRDFESLPPRVGLYIISSEFDTGDSNEFLWGLNLYPHGYDESNRDYVSVRLAYYADLEQVKIHVVLSIVKADGSEACEERRTMWLRCGQEERYFYKFVRRDQLLDPNNGLLPKGHLSLRCKIYPVASSVQDFSPLGDASRRLAELDVYEDMFEDASFSDVKLVCSDGKEFRAHKALLAARSKIFRAMFEHEMREKNEGRVEIVDVEPVAMGEMLRFLYVGKVKDLKELARFLLPAADKYELPGLKEMSARALMDGLDVENVCETLVLADRHGEVELFDCAMEFAGKHAMEIVEAKNFKSIRKCLPDCLLDLLRLKAECSWFEFSTDESESE